MEENKIIDMHIHTNNSDGEHTVLELVERIKETDIGTFSITDHDNIDSATIIKDIDLGDLEFYNGVEISGKYENIGVHILGYDFDITDEIINLVEKIKKNRKKRIFELLEMLYQRYGIEIPDEIVEEILSNQVAGRPHVAKALYELGFGKTYRESFDKYLKDYTSKTSYKVNIKEAIKTVKAANGIVILAHPKEIENRHKISFESILPGLVEEGIDGIEVYNNIHSESDVERYLNLAKKYNLLISGGSDYHGPFVKPDVVLGGVTQEKANIKKLSLVDELRQRKPVKKSKNN